MKCTVSIVCLLALLCPHTGAADELPADLGQNAALLVWQSAALMPELSDEEQELLNRTPHDEFLTIPLDDDVTRLLGRCDSSLHTLRRAAEIEECDWGVQWQDGPAALMPHLGKARMLIRLATLRARLKLQQSAAADPMSDDRRQLDLEAVHDLLAANQLARHAGSDDLLVSQLVCIGMEQLVFDVLTQHMLDLHPDAQRLLLKRLGEMPAAGQLDVAVLRESKVFLGWMKASLEGKDEDRAYADFLEQFSPDQQDHIRKHAPDLAAVKVWIDGAERMYEELAEIAKLPPGAVGEPLKRLQERVEKSDNLIASTFLPSLDRARAAEAKAQVRRRMLQAAACAALGLEPEYADIKDPFGEGPFDRRRAANRLTLVSELTIDGEQFTASFDLREK